MGDFSVRLKVNETMCCAEIQPFAAGEITELVRGNENALLERFMPIVRRQCVTLNLEAVTRIDAAGLAALITVYCTARESGHDFTILNPSSHVAEILAVVGLDKILVAQNAGSFSESRIPAEATAA
jgi:anti-anti-sigma factor